ncbi:aspartic proteinase nepenthesin-1-like [Miscanthus floridulus]|uniref:aspartic proteinase nepenthesin-1-like n=1 Tax=Miscanthus floridulus TaxID=154761 RepID=UPI0034590894
MAQFAVRSLLLSLLLVSPALASPGIAKLNSSSPLFGIEFPPFNTAVAVTGCDSKLAAAEAAVGEQKQPASPSPSLKLHMNRRTTSAGGTRKESLLDLANKDAVRIETMHRRAARSGGDRTPGSSSPRRALSERMVATVESGVAVGSGEYLMDVYVGTPPRRFRMIMDTGSDLNWLQCAPCLDCFEQLGPVFDPAASSSYRNVTCGDQRCGLVAPPPEAAPRACRRPGEDSCPYYYWYGDQSNTTGDLALESFTVNLTAPGASRRVDGVVFGCGHWNRGLFHGAAGLLGLGRGPLSFASQLRAVYGHTFSYCLVEHGSDVASKVVFGEDDALSLAAAHPQLNYTAFAPASSPADTFYYVKLKGVLVGGELLNISSDTWDVGSEGGSGGTIIDSGTTLSYFVEPAYQVIRQAFIDRMSRSYPLVPDFPVLSPCYNVSGVERPEVPELSLLFADGAVWDFPAENYFIRLEDGIMCLAVLGTPRTGMSIIGNFQQQNFHVVYDLHNNRLGFAPRRCAEV